MTRALDEARSELSLFEREGQDLIALARAEVVVGDQHQTSAPVGETRPEGQAFEIVELEAQDLERQHAGLGHRPIALAFEALPPANIGGALERNQEQLDDVADALGIGAFEGQQMGAVESQQVDHASRAKVVDARRGVADRLDHVHILSQ